MKRFIFLLFFISTIFYAQSKQDLLNNLQRGGNISIVSATPLSTHYVLTWDGDEIKIVTVSNLGSQGVFETLVADIVAPVALQMDSAATCGVDTFATTAEADTVEILGALATDLYLVTGRGGSVDQQDVLQVEAKADTLIVHRLASGASGLVYNWFRFTHE